MADPVIDLRVVTALAFAENSLKRINQMSFFYDPNWVRQERAGAQESLPFAFIEVIKDDIVLSNEISKKRVILYEPDTSAKDKRDTFRPSAMSIISDNVVTHPVVHNIECLIPYGFITKIFTNVSDAVAVVTSVFNFSSDVQLTKAQETLALIQQIVHYAEKFVGLASSFFPYDSNAYNINSIKAMHRNASIVKFKSWDSWDFKYGVLGPVRISKVGTEDDYVRCSLEFVELPILSIGIASDTAGRSNTRNSILSKTIKKAFDTFVDFSTRGNEV